MKFLYIRLQGLEELIVDSERLDSELSAEEWEIMEFEQRHFDLKLKFQGKIDAIDASRSINVTGQNISIAIPTEQSNANFRLPKLNIPVFSGKFEDWINFKDLFETAVHSQTSLGNIQKFRYLKASVGQQEISNIELGTVNTTLNSSTVNNAKCVSFSPTAKVLLYNNEGGSFLFRALLDSGSESSFISENAIIILGLQRCNDRLSLCEINGIQAGTTSGSVGLKIGSRFCKDQLTIKAHILNKVTSQIPVERVNIMELNYLEGIPLADEDFSKPSECDVVLGSDCFFSILRTGRITGSKGQPIAQSTIFGWVVADALEASYACVVYAVKRNRETAKVVMLGGKSKAWTDSLVVLSWLSSPPRNWKPFVANRTSEILDIIPCKQWRYVPSKEIPANLGSRGMSPKDLPYCSLWWEGPQWLSTEEAWHKQPTIKDKRDIEKSVIIETKRTFVFSVYYLCSIAKMVRTKNVPEEIEWHTIPSLSPHFGELWEAGFNSVKFHLKRVVGSINLTFEEFYTLLTQIEAVLNSRPLVRLVDNDIESLDVLTPSHFLVGEEIIGPPETVEESKLTLKGRWDIVQKLKLNFWKRWQIDYLNSIQGRTKCESGTSNIKIGDVVIIKEDNHPSVWPLGKLIPTHPGKDGIVRVVTLKTKKRTVSKTYSKVMYITCASRINS
ncbi:DUF5641 domain-containing protein [Trichonephila clavipes]|nr:DUF5641 domain-containing protein [Trichonephila clavipes]